MIHLWLNNTGVQSENSDSHISLDVPRQVGKIRLIIGLNLSHSRRFDTVLFVTGVDHLKININSSSGPFKHPCKPRQRDDELACKNLGP